MCLLLARIVYTRKELRTSNGGGTGASRYPMKTPVPTNPAQLEVVDPRWLLKAIGYVVLAALVCGYLTLCLLFYQGQWQLIVHPGLNNKPLSTLAGLPAQPVHFDAAETGSPRLSGALLPAEPSARYRAYTVLYVRSADSALAQDANDARNLAVLHTVGLNVFAFDYRGYGQSDPIHPNQARMTEDAGAALRYLVDSRAVAPANIVLYGTGLGTSLATALASSNRQISTLILDSPGPTPLSIVLADSRTRLLPVRALFHEDFTLAPLADLTTPKLLLSVTPAFPGIFQTAANPKITVETNPDDIPGRTAAISRFLDQYLTPKL